MLNHRRPATIHITTKIIFFQFTKIHFFVFITRTGKNSTRIGIDHETIIFRLITIKLCIGISSKTFARLVFYLISDIYQVTVTGKSIGFNHGQPVIRFPTHRNAQTIFILPHNIFGFFRSIGFIMCRCRAFGS